MWHLKHSPRSRFDLERLVFGNQLFHQRSVHAIQNVIRATIRAKVLLSKLCPFI